MQGIILIESLIVAIALLIIINKSVKKSQLKSAFVFVLSTEIICLVGLTLQTTLSSRLSIPPIYFDYIVYIGTCFFPVGILLTGIIFAHTKIKLSKKYLLLAVVPLISLCVLWTNDWHHLFYEAYSINLAETKFGPYFTIHSIYSYACIFIGLAYLIVYSVKNSNFFSKQSVLIFIGTAIPVLTNVLRYI